MTRNPPVHEQNLPPHLYENDYEDEINLVDLWLILMKHRTLRGDAVCVGRGYVCTIDP